MKIKKVKKTNYETNYLPMCAWYSNKGWTNGYQQFSNGYDAQCWAKQNDTSRIYSSNYTHTHTSSNSSQSESSGFYYKKKKEYTEEDNKIEKKYIPPYSKKCNKCGKDKYHYNNYTCLPCEYTHVCIKCHEDKLHYPPNKYDVCYSCESEIIKKYRCKAVGCKNDKLVGDEHIYCIICVKKDKCVRCKRNFLLEKGRNIVAETSRCETCEAIVKKNPDAEEWRQIDEKLSKLCCIIN